MKKKEASFQTMFNQWLRAKRPHGYFELKVAKTNSLPFSAVERHQEYGLMGAQESGLVWKYSDEDSRQKPFDCSCTPPLPAYVAIKYPDGMVTVILIKRFLEERALTGKKSLKKERAKELATFLIEM